MAFSTAPYVTRPSCRVSKRPEVAVRVNCGCGTVTKEKTIEKKMREKKVIEKTMIEKKMRDQYF